MPKADLYPPAQSSSRKSQHYLALDGLRGLAILMVFFFHYGDLTSSSSIFLRTVGFIKSAGWAGVDLFFVLSGFLITGILYNTLSAPNFFSAFYMRRVLRLFPVFYGTALLLLLLTPIFHIHWRSLQLWYFVYAANILQNYDFNLSFAGPFLLMHLWSLALEEQFYMIWPLMIYLIKDRRTLLKLCVAVIVLAPLLRIFLLFSPYVSTLFIYYQLPTRMDSFVVGGALALLLREVEVAALIGRAKIVLAASLAVLIAVAVVQGNFNFRLPGIVAVGYSALAFFFAALILLALQPATITYRIFSNSILRFYGSISYGFYVFHELIHNLTRPIYLFYLGLISSATIAGVLYTFTVLGLVTAISYLSFKYFETPFLRLKNRFQYHSRSEARAEVPAVSS